MTNGEQAQTYEHMPVQYEEKSNRLFCLHQTELTPYHHFHSHVELVCKHSGETRVFADKQSATLRAGDLFWAFPNQIHYYQDISPGENTVLLIPEQYYQDYRHLLYHYAPKEPCIRNFLQTQRYVYLWEQILSGINTEGVAASITKGYLCALMGELLHHAELQPVNAGDSDSIRLVINYCSQNYTKKLTLTMLEKELHISKYHISHLLSDTLHIGFNDYINSLRIADACTRLQADTPITQTAFLSGFSAIRSFNRAFLRCMGMSPREYCRFIYNK